jgi:hypothetical protein
MLANLENGVFTARLRHSQFDQRRAPIAYGSSGLVEH